MLVESLMRLMEDGEYASCIRLAEMQLLQGGFTLSELAKVNLVVCRSRLGLQDAQGAIPPGLLAIKLARDTGEWDVLGRALLNVGTAFISIRQYSQALHHLYSYFEHLHRYSSSARFEGAVWRHIAVAHQRKLESSQAVDAFRRACSWYARQGMDHSLFNCTHDLIATYLQQAEQGAKDWLEPVKELLQSQRQIARKYPTETYYQGYYMWELAARYRQEGRYRRAMVGALKAMEIHKDDPELAFHCHMLLHECSKVLGDGKQALGYALAARVEAVRARHYELEFLASQAMAEVIRQKGSRVVQELDDEYQQLGIDLRQYLSPSLLRRN